MPTAPRQIPSAPSTRRTILVFSVRYVLPALIVLAGILTLIISPSWDTAEGAAAVIGAGLSVWLLNLLWRVGVRGDEERHAEDAAREYFDKHGRWPDEAETSGSRRERQ